MEYYKNLGTRVLLAFLLNPVVFYFIFAPITLFLSYLILLGYHPIVSFAENTILIKGTLLNFVKGCIAPSAYYLLTLLVLFSKDISWKKRAKVWFIGAMLLLGMNLLRISIVVFVLLNFGKNGFDAIHIFFWEFVSTIYVFLVWIFLIKKFKIKGIPVYDDIKILYEKSILGKERKNTKRQ